MTHKERILAAVNHQPVDKTPTDMWMWNTPEVQDMFYMDYNINF